MLERQEKMYGIESVDVFSYELYCNGAACSTVYICPYGYDSMHAPKGFILSAQKDDRLYGGNIQKEADARELMPEQVLALQRLDYESEQAARQREKEAAEKDAKERAILEAKAEQVKKEYPGFDLWNEMKKEVFSSLALSEVDMTTLYEYVNKEHWFIRKKSPNFVGGETAPLDCEENYAILMSYVELEDISAVLSIAPDEVSRQAKEEGLTIQQYLAMKRLERENVQLRNERIRQQAREWAQQAVEFSQEYPQFRFEQECEDELFVHLMGRCALRTAYELVHFNELYTRIDRTVHAEEITDEVQQTESDKELCPKCGIELLPESSYCHKCGEKIERAESNESVVKSGKYQRSFEKFYVQAVRIADQCPMIENAAFELMPAMFVIADYAASVSKKNREKIADEIMGLIANSAMDQGKSNWPEEFDKRVELYGSAIRGRKLRGEWLDFETEAFEANGLLRCVLMVGDILYNSMCVDNYDQAPVMLRGLYEKRDFASITMAGIAEQLTGLFEEISNSDD